MRFPLLSYLTISLSSQGNEDKKQKALVIKQSICNMEDVISFIQASTSVQEEKVDSLEQVRVNSELA